MSYKLILFPQFPETVVFLSLFRNVNENIISKIKENIMSWNEDYDFCFLNTDHIVSLEQLYCSIHKAMLNHRYGCMKARTLNAEIILNLCPTNNIMEAFKKFGINESCSNAIIIKVLPKSASDSDNLQELNKHVTKLVGSDSSKNRELTDDTLFKIFDERKFKKIYKLNDANSTIDAGDIQQELTRLSIFSCQLRGF